MQACFGKAVRLAAGGAIALGILCPAPAAAQIIVGSGPTGTGFGTVSVTGGPAATFTQSGGSLSNSGTLQSDVAAVTTAGNPVGIRLDNARIITSTGGTAVALTTGSDQTVTNLGSGIITGVNGIVIVSDNPAGSVTVINGALIGAARSGTAISVSGSGGSITNSGDIGGGTGITTSTGTSRMVITNGAGGVIQATDVGLSLNGTTTLTNRGIISGVTAIRLEPAASPAGISYQIVNDSSSGRISGSVAVDNQSGAPMTLVNSGVIGGTIRLGTAGDTVLVQTLASGLRAQILGDIVGRNVAGERVLFDTAAGGPFTTGGAITGVREVTVQSGTAIFANPVSGGQLFATQPGGTAVLQSTLSADTITNAGTIQVDTPRSVTGSYSQTGTLAIGIATAGNGTLSVTGPATLANGSRINAIVNAARLIRPGESFQVLTASGGLTVNGTPSVTSNLNTLAFTASQSGNSEIITTREDTGSPLGILQRSGGAASGVAGAIQAILTGNFALAADLQAALGTLQSLPSTQLNAALTSLTVNTGTTTGAALGAITGTSAGNALVSTRLQQARDAAGGGTRAAPQAWAQVHGGSLTQGVRDGFAGFTADSYGFLLGGDREVADAVRLGAAVGFGRTDVRSDASRPGDSATVDGYSATLYGSYDPGRYFVDGLVTAGFNGNDTLRRIDFAGLTAKGSYDSRQVGVRINAGLPLALAGVTITPHAFAQALHLDRDGYTERNAGGVGLRVRGDDTDSAQLGAGLRIARPLPVATGTVVPELRVSYFREVGDDRIPASMSFIGGGPRFSTAGPSIARDNLKLGVGASFFEMRDLSISLAYDYLVNDANTAHAGTARLRLSF